MGVRILLVEGSDDQHVMWSLFNHLPENPGIFVCKPGDEPDFGDPGRVKLGESEGGGADGVARLLESIPARLVTSGLERLTVVIDSDDKGPQARWDAIRQRLDNEGYKNLARTPTPEGTILELPSVSGRKPLRFGVWIMPDNRSKGMLEDFLAQMIQDDDDMLPLVKDFLKSIPKPHFSPTHRPKARIHSWLAVQEEPGTRMGLAITREYLDANRDVVQPFLKWINHALITDGQRP